MADDDDYAEQAARLQAQIDRLTEELNAATNVPRTAAVSHVGIKIGPFWKRDPSLWFNQIEAQFSLARITADDTKFFHVASKIDTEILECCADIIRDPPTDGTKYDSIKARIIAEYAPSKKVRMQMLFQHTELGDRKPSQLLREMQALATGITADEEVIKQLWLQRLPEMSQSVLNVLEKRASLKELVEEADKLAEISRSAAPTVMTVNAPSSELQELRLEIAAMRAENNANRRGPRSNRRPLAREPSSDSEEICYYHRRFKEKAERCRSPCKFRPKN